MDMVAVTGRPKYLQIADDLRAKIAAGEYPVGEMLPSMSQLMATYEVSITVVRDALKELRNDGITMGQQGKGVYVQRRPDPVVSAPELAEIAQRVAELAETLTASVRDVQERLTALEGQLAVLRSERQPG